MWPFNRRKKKQSTEQKKAEPGGPYRARFGKNHTSRIITTVQPFEFSFECEDGVIVIGYLDYTIEIDPEVFKFFSPVAGARMCMETIGTVCDALHMKTSDEVFELGSSSIQTRVTDRFDGYSSGFLEGLRLVGVTDVSFRIAERDEKLPRYKIIRLGNFGEPYSIRV